MKVNSEGVSASRVYLPADQTYSNLLEFFSNQFPHIDSNEWVARFNEGLIRTTDNQPVVSSDAYRPNSHLLYFRRLAREPDIPFEEEILYQDFTSHAKRALLASDFTQSFEEKNGDSIT
jgi:tRNA pseudouridine32 synthase / 23S rRNA pseudouridine746 synthase